jgi:hypothetical protein
MADGARDTITEVTSDRRVDMMGCVGRCYHNFIVFNVLGHMGIVVI